jgi:calcium-dependent protein kinase
MHTILGTPYYIAPEVLKGEYDEKCDIWSIGAMTYIMLCGEPPFNAETNNEIFTKIVKEKLQFTSENWKNVSEDAKDFIKKCMTKESEKRLSASSALDHPWFKNILKEVHKEEYLATDILSNLRNFSTPEKFKKIVLKFFVNNISQREMNKLTKAFFAIDLDHSGQIDVNDLTKAFKLANIEISEDELKKIIKSSKEDTFDGKIDYNEFLMACMNQKKNIGKEKLIQAFKYFDIDDSGYIDASDLKNTLLRSGKQVVNPSEIDDIIQEINAKDNKISLEQFLQLFDLK